MFFFGWSATLLWMPRLGDIYGRKWLIAYNNLICFALYLGVLFAPNIYFLATVIFLWGFFNSIRTNVTFLYMMELMPTKNKAFIGTFWNCCEGLINLFATFFFMKISTNWFDFTAIGLCFQVFACCTVWFLPESPIYLLKRGRFDELKAALQQVASYNDSVLDWDAYSFTTKEVE